MKDGHIINLLESVSFVELTDEDHRSIKTHAMDCDDCARAYQVAVVSSSLLIEGHGEVFEPSPFFQTRVMAAIREQQDEPRGFAKIWRAAGALVSTMAASVALMAVLIFVAPATQTARETPSDGYTAEEVILDQGELAQERSDAEILSTLYVSEEDER